MASATPELQLPAQLQGTRARWLVQIILCGAMLKRAGLLSVIVLL